MLSYFSKFVSTGLLGAIRQPLLTSMIMWMGNLFQHPEVCALVSEVLNSKLPQPRYMFVLSVESVINYIKTKWKNNKILSGKYLNYKLVMLIPLTSASKASAMHCLEVSFMVKSEDAYIFTFYKLQKSWRKGEALPKLQNYVFISTQKIKNCVWCLPYIST